MSLLYLVISASGRSSLEQGTYKFWGTHIAVGLGLARGLSELWRSASCYLRFRLRWIVAGARPVRRRGLRLVAATRFAFEVMQTASQDKIAATDFKLENMLLTTTGIPHS